MKANQSCGFTLKCGLMSLRVKLSVVFTASNQLENSEKQVCRIAYVYMTCNPAHSSSTYDLSTLNVMSEENGCRVTTVYSKVFFLW